jgi:hypothetical protein
MRLIAFVTASSVIAAAPLAPSLQDAPPSWSITDSVLTDTWDLMGEHHVYQVRLILRSRTAIVRGVVQPLPIVIGDSVIAGVRQSPASGERELFLWNGRSSRPRFYAVPDDVWAFFTDLAIAPDGSHLAYVGMDKRSGAIYAAVRRWPAGDLVVRGPDHPNCDCDVDLNHARWVGPDSFEIAVPGPGRRYTRFSGNPRARALHQDTLSQEPQWH